MWQKISIFILVFCFIFVGDSSYSQNRKSSVSQAARTITVLTEPNAAVWIDGVKRGVTDDSGKLFVKPVMAGVRKLRVRADGFKEIEKPLLPTQKGDIKIALIKTNDQAELAYQEAEKMAGEDKNKAIELYEKAVNLRPDFPEAYLGLARVLSETGDADKALNAIKNARKYRPVYPEASAVEGRIYKDISEFDKAIASFDRAVKEGKGFQPEAHTGLALLFKDEAESAKADNDLDDVKYYYGLSAKSFEKAIEQLSATEPVVYLFLGKIYEDMHDKKKAIAVYERFLRDMPDNEERTAVESFIVQLKKPDIIQ
ncbi:MAG: tetratricopeptide repeat protein [Acidobacteriota bacterium]|jgi:tetratricopeptide (TPR) repeat protein|nr:tetratricopeptide repeat protein [Acidobacteriota bacterium]